MKTLDAMDRWEGTRPRSLSPLGSVTWSWSHSPSKGIDGNTCLTNTRIILRIKCECVRRGLVNREASACAHICPQVQRGDSWAETLRPGVYLHLGHARTPFQCRVFGFCCPICGIKSPVASGALSLARSLALGAASSRAPSVLC